MAVALQPPAALPAVGGVRLGTARAGIRYQGRDDLLLVELAPESVAAARFTRNAFCAAPVTVARDHLAGAMPRYWLINSGNANAGTGAEGMAAANQCCAAVASLTSCSSGEVLPFSTGVIGESLPVDRIVTALPDAVASLESDGWLAAAHSIMTTDTVAKGASRRVEVEGRTFVVTGIAKGSGMIRPDMATMLAFVATDAPMTASLLDEALDEAVERSFNRITVDGDTSTNDACVIAATGCEGGATITGYGVVFEAVCEAISEVCSELALAIVRDGEGATKLITIDVTGAATREEALSVAYTIAHSPLVKTAFHASDPNWGRILAAVGRAGVEELDLNAVTIDLGDVRIVTAGGRDSGYREESGARVMAEEEITITVDLARGSIAERVWTTDLSYEYVRINAEYRS
jgi:glutamate N-acetyltransferase/amino-acid N-acetyltransferase